MSSTDAAGQLANGIFDVVVADERIVAAGEGHSFLDEVAARQPKAVRYLLSGRHGASVLLHADRSAHQHLLKPLGAEFVFARLAQTLVLGDLLADADLQRVIGRLTRLPSLPPVYLAIMAELKKDEASGRKVGELVARDGGMSAKILQLVNSPFFGLRMRVSDPAQAIQLLGLETVRGLVLSAHVFEQVDLRTATRFRLGKVWRHSLATAGYARLIARQNKATADVEGEAFTGALLHDIGKLVLAASLSDDYAIVVEQAESEKIATWLVERDLLRTTHAEVGAYLLSLWGLPEPIVETVASHHQPSRSPAPAYCPLGVVHTANVIEHRTHPADTIAAPSETDDAYLDRFEMRSHVPEWTAACMATGA
jgi:putative nucleotidyltransferase with HDIG domain